MAAPRAPYSPTKIWPDSKLDPVWRACTHGFKATQKVLDGLQPEFRQTLEKLTVDGFDDHKIALEDEGAVDPFVESAHFWPTLVPSDGPHRDCGVEFDLLDEALRDGKREEAKHWVGPWSQCLLNNESKPERSFVRRLINCYRGFV